LNFVGAPAQALAPRERFNNDQGAQGFASPDISALRALAVSHTCIHSADRCQNRMVDRCARVTTERSVDPLVVSMSLRSHFRQAPGPQRHGRCSFWGRGRARCRYPRHPQRHRTDPPGTRGGHRGQSPRRNPDQETRATCPRVHRLPSRHRDCDIALLFLMSYMIFLTKDLLPQVQDQLAGLGTRLRGYSCRLGNRHIRGDRGADLEAGDVVSWASSAFLPSMAPSRA